MTPRVASRLDEIEQVAASFDERQLLQSAPDYLRPLSQHYIHTGRRVSEMDLAVCTRSMHLIDMLLWQREIHFSLQAVLYHYWQELQVPPAQVAHEYKKCNAIRSSIVDEVGEVSRIASQHEGLAWGYVDHTPDIRNDWAAELQLVRWQRDDMSVRFNRQCEVQGPTRITLKPVLLGTPRGYLSRLYHMAATLSDNVTAAGMDLLDMMTVRAHFLKAAVANVTDDEFDGIKRDMKHVITLGRQSASIGAQCRDFQALYLE